MKYTLMIFGTALLFSSILAGPTQAADKKESGKNIMLTSLEPEEAEFGTYEYPDANLRPIVQAKGAGPGIFDTGVFISGNVFWPESRKIVKEPTQGSGDPIKAEDYRSKMQDCFFVSGEQVTGVGFWAQTTMFYHLYEYKIPTGAKKFKATLYVTDDSKGYMMGMPGGPDAYSGWQDCTFKVLIDGKEVYNFKRNESGVAMGSGKILDEIEVDIPSGAKVIKFILETSSAIDWNKNVELVLSDGQFVM